MMHSSAAMKAATFQRRFIMKQTHCNLGTPHRFFPAGRSWEMSFSADLAAIVSPNDSMLDKRTRTFLTGSVLLLTLRRTCVHANPEPSSANRTGYYVESTNVHPLPI